MSDLAIKPVLRSLSIESFLKKCRRKPALKKDDGMFGLSMAVNYLIVQDGKIDSTRFIAEMEKHGYDGLAMANQMLRGVADHGLFCAMSHYSDNTTMKYIPSQPLLDVLASVDVDVPLTYLPENISAYFEITGKIKKGLNGNINWMYVYKNQDAPLITIVVNSDEPERFSTFIYNAEVDKTMESGLDEMIRNGYDQLEGIDNKMLMRVLMNLLIYVSNPDESFIQQFNEFSPKRKIAQAQRNQYTTEPYIVIGEDVQFLRLCIVDKTTVKCHWRNQPCGEGRLQRKWVLIKEHERHYKTLHGESTNN